MVLSQICLKASPMIIISMLVSLSRKNENGVIHDNLAGMIEGTFVKTKKQQFIMFLNTIGIHHYWLIFRFVKHYILPYPYAGSNWSLWMDYL